MNKTVDLVLVAILVIIITVGCKKKNDAPVLPNYFIKATINGSYFDSSCTSGGIGSRELSIAGGFIDLYIYGNRVPGTSYLIDNLVNIAHVDSPGKSIASLYGTLTIDSILSSSITGTFTFTCTDSSKVTNGSFVCPVPKQ